jgi:hypothetical protein
MKRPALRRCGHAPSEPHPHPLTPAELPAQDN